MSKIREALEEVVSILSTWTDHLPPVIQDEVQEAIEKAEAALDEPLRNCDIGTAEEQAIRFHKYCSRQSQDDIFCLGCPLIKEERCELVWSQMPYEKGETNEQ